MMTMLLFWVTLSSIVSTLQAMCTCRLVCPYAGSTCAYDSPLHPRRCVVTVDKCIPSVSYEVLDHSHGHNDWLLLKIPGSDGTITTAYGHRHSLLCIGGTCCKNGIIPAVQQLTTLPTPALCTDEKQSLCGSHQYGECALGNPNMLMECSEYCGYCTKMQASVSPSTSQSPATAFLHNGHWFYACADDWNHDTNGNVVCKMIGSGTRGYLRSQWHAIEPWMDELLHNVKCMGHEDNLGFCPYTVKKASNCTGGQVVLVECKMAQCKVEISETVPHTGTLMITENHGKQQVCFNGWTPENTKVACTMAGYQHVSTPTFTKVPKDARYTIYGRQFNCQGTESDFQHCMVQSNPYVSDHCQDVVYINCDGFKTTTELTTLPTLPKVTQTTPAPTPTHLGIRLVGGMDPQSGRLEVFYNGVWGTVCDDRFDVNAAKVVCHQLGYDVQSHSVTLYYPRAFYGQGSGPIHLDDVICLGNETNIGQCHYPGIDVSDCFHDEDVGVACYGHPLTTKAPAASTASTTSIKGTQRPSGTTSNWHGIGTQKPLGTTSSWHGIVTQKPTTSNPNWHGTGSQSPTTLKWHLIDGPKTSQATFQLVG